MMLCRRRLLSSDAAKALRHALREQSSEIAQQAGPPSRRRAAFRRTGAVAHPSTEAVLDARVRELSALFERAEAGGHAVRDRKTLSSFVRVLCTPHAPWERRERERALRLFEESQVRRHDEPWPGGGGLAGVSHPGPSAQQPAPDAAGGGGGAAVSTSGVWPAQWSAAEVETIAGKGGEVDEPVGMGPGTCAVGGCGAVPRYGSTVDGWARVCKEHMAAGERRVDLQAEALYALADSCVEVRPPRLAAAAQVYWYALTAAQRAYYEAGHAQERAPRPLAMLNRLFAACAREAAMPEEATRLLPLLTADADAPEGGKRAAVRARPPARRGSAPRVRVAVQRPEPFCRGDADPRAANATPLPPDAATQHTAEPAPVSRATAQRVHVRVRARG
eukprot:4557540-Prymnesium_polylepis.2